MKTDLDHLTGLKRAAIVATIAMLAVHLFAAGRLELDFDEAYYTLWSRSLSPGYVDHPPMVAFWIRASTSLFGASEFGIRALSAIAVALGALGVYTLARILFPRRPTIGWVAALLFNAMPLLAVAGYLTTPDTPLVTFWTIAVLFIALIWRSGSAWGWLGLGVAAGLALQSKYTALFLGAGIVLAMLAVPSLRRWFAHPVPYVGGVVALLIFAPVINWNARHEWVSFAKQFGRASEGGWTLAFIGEFAGVLAGLANPAVFAMACASAWFVWRDRPASLPALDTDGEARRLLLAVIAPALLYFVNHSLHDQVQGNWTAPLFPILAVMAADWATATASPRWPEMARLRAVAWSSAIAIALSLVTIAHAITGFLPLPPKRDITAQRLHGWRQLAVDVHAVAVREKAGYVLTTGYALTSHLRVYSVGAPIASQINERARWDFEGWTLATMSDETRGPGLYVTEAGREELDFVTPRFTAVREVARIERTFAGQALRTYVIYRVEGPKVPLLLAPRFKLPL